MLELKDLTVAYPHSAPVLNGISLTLTPGITAVIGRNGVGKSTLLHTLLGEIPYAGKLLIDGKSATTLTARERAKFLSLLPQMLPAPALTVRECIALGFSPSVTRLSDKEWQRVAEIESALSLSHLDTRRVNTLSGGERQRVFFGLALAQNTPVLLLDEPTAHIDLAFLASFRSILQALRDEGKCVLTVLHDLNTALQWADRILLLEEGKIAFDGTPTACIEAEIPERHFSLTHYTATDQNGAPVHFYAP